MALLTKPMGIVTPLVLSIVVVVAPRLILYRDKPQDHIVQGFRDRKKKKGKEAVQCSCMICEVRSKCDITPSSGSTSAATSLVLIDEDLEFGAIDQLDALVNPGSCHALGASS